MWRWPSKKHSRSIQCHRDEPQASVDDPERHICSGATALSACPLSSMGFPARTRHSCSGTNCDLDRRWISTQMTPPKHPPGPPMTLGQYARAGRQAADRVACYNGRCSLPKSQPIPSETKTAARGRVSMVSRNDLSNDLAVCRARAPVPSFLRVPVLPAMFPGL